MKPTVGRIVHFYRRPDEDAEPYAAIIVHVWSDTRVNLAVFGHLGNAISPPPTFVQLLQDGDPVPSKECYCKWPERI